MSEQANVAQHAAIKTEARGNWALTMLARSTVDSHRVVFRLVNNCNKEKAVGSKRARKSGKGVDDAAWSEGARTRSKRSEETRDAL